MVSYLFTYGCKDKPIASEQVKKYPFHGSIPIYQAKPLTLPVHCLQKTKEYLMASPAIWPATTRGVFKCTTFSIEAIIYPPSIYLADCQT